MADIRPYPFFGSGAPTNGTSGTKANVAGNGKGAKYIDVATGNEYVNTNTKASPTWAVASSAEEAAFLLAVPTTAITDFLTVSNPPTQAEVNAIVAKANVLLAQLRTAGIITP